MINYYLLLLALLLLAMKKRNDENLETPTGKNFRISETG
jgi:hypothetical protein